MRQTVVGVFDKYAAAQRAAQHLRASGFSDSVFVTDEVDEAAGAGTERAEDRGVFDSVRQFFAELFGRDEDPELRTYAEAVRRGGAVVKVEVDERQADEARSALESAGAVDIEERSREWQASGWSPASQDVGSAGDATASAADRQARREDQGVIPVVQEELQVGKRTVQTGAVRVYAHTVETPVEDTVTLRSERAEVERRPVDRPATEADLQAFQDRTIEVRETAEQPVVAKTARVVEEVAVSKAATERTERIGDTVRGTRVEVEQAGEDRDATFRRDFESRYGAAGERYEDYEPAYRYGDALAADPRYRGRAWEEVEADARRDWEARYPGSAWDRFKAAIRHGWDRLTH